ncbi:MAG: sulfite exporter TauE/SafE family protein, partial [Propionibacteriaceae bacterium]|nr:sulfite exporter TauE/SafE family protein [Propionibacteriaceae bacterium]
MATVGGAPAPPRPGGPAVFGLTPLAWACLGLAAFVVGLSKTSIAGLGSVAVVLFALVLPAKESTAAVLLLLICGDLVAVAVYRRQADWGQLRRLLPAVLPGIGLGAVFLAFASDRVLLLAIGGLVLAAVLLQIGLRRHSAKLGSAANATATAEPAAAPAPASAAPPPPALGSAGAVPA